jgi:hypothetical protein
MGLSFGLVTNILIFPTCLGMAHARNADIEDQEVRILAGMIRE